MVKLTQEEIEELISEEMDAYEMYNHYGLKSFARDELKHANHWKKVLKEKYG